MTTIDAKSLEPYIKSKKNLYNILANEGKLLIVVAVIVVVVITSLLASFLTLSFHLG